jgi:hypothetical protein
LVANDRAERILRIVVAVDRVVVDLLFALVIEGIGAIEKVKQLFNGSFSLPADAPHRFEQLFR